MNGLTACFKVHDIAELVERGVLNWLKDSVELDEYFYHFKNLNFKNLSWHCQVDNTFLECLKWFLGCKIFFLNLSVDKSLVDISIIFDGCPKADWTSFPIIIIVLTLGVTCGYEFLFADLGARGL